MLSEANMNSLTDRSDDCVHYYGFRLSIQNCTRGGGSCGFYLLSLKMYISRKFIRLIGFPSTFDRHCVLDHKGTDDLVLFSRKDLGLSFSLASLSHTR